jgi:hypothetical protein
MKARRALFLFHLRVGARLALRVLAPVLAAILFFHYILGPEFALELARILFVEGSLVESGLAGTMLLLGLARVVSPRISAGNGGWARSLPVGPGAQRLSALLSLVIAESPLLAVLAVFAWAVTDPGPMPGAALTVRVAEHIVRVLPHLAGLVAGAAAAGLVSLPPASPRGLKIVPAAACFLSFAGEPAVLAVSVLLLVVATVLPGGGPSPRTLRGPLRGLPAAAFFQALSLRAVRGRIALAFLPALLVLGASRLFLANNDLAPRSAAAISLFGLALALAAIIGPAADLLAARRPAWPWLRSLPRSAASRVMDDAILLALLGLPLLAFGLALLGRPAWQAVYLAGPLAWLAVRGAGAMREAGDRPFGALGQVAIEGAILSLVLALLPWTSFLFAAAAPGAFLLARNAERRLKPTLWAERRHSDAGDPLSWSAS